MIIELKEKYKVVSAEEGMRITDHVGEDYTNYASWGRSMMAHNADISNWREITEAEDNENIERQLQQLREQGDGEQ